MKNFLKENWFKLALILLGIYAIHALAYGRLERQLWTQERFEAYRKCLDSQNFNLPVSNTADSYKQAFRACKTVSDYF